MNLIGYEKAMDQILKQVQVLQLITKENIIINASQFEEISFQEVSQELIC